MSKYKWLVKYKPHHSGHQIDTVITDNPSVENALLEWQKGKNLSFVGMETVRITWVYKDQIDIEETDKPLQPTWELSEPNIASALEKNKNNICAFHECDKELNDKDPKAGPSGLKICDDCRAYINGH